MEKLKTKNKMEIEKNHDSSTLEKSIFNEEENILTVHFKNGSIYEYSNFNKEDYESFINAASTGSYFYHNIRNNFPYSKL